MPLTGRDFCVYAVDLLPTAFDDAVKSHVVFKGVCPHNVIIVAVSNSDGNAPGLIDVARD